MSPPHDSTLPPGVYMTRLQNGNLVPSESLVKLIVTARENYDWPKGTGAAESQQTILNLETRVANFLASLYVRSAHWIVKDVSVWGGNNKKAQGEIDKASSQDQTRMLAAIRLIINSSTLKAGLDELSGLGGLRLVMATKVFRFCCSTTGAAVDQNASYFFNSLEIVGLEGERNKSTSFKREWPKRSHNTSRLAIYYSQGHARNCKEFVEVYLPLLTQIAHSLNEMGVTYRCAATGMHKSWRPADVEMAAYYWWAHNGPR